MKRYEDLTYTGQVRRLRGVAKLALKQYKIKYDKLIFIHHGENATFRVVTSKGKYLLRLHRPRYHSNQAITEELRWIEHLRQNKGYQIQEPQRTKKNELITEVMFGDIERRVSLMSWIDGRIVGHKYDNDHLKAMGSLLSSLHKDGGAFKCRHRKYWDREGLLGKKSLFGYYDQLKPEYSQKNFEILTEIHKQLNAKIRKYEHKKRNVKGFIHADLHFYNVVWSKYQVTPIDFDDCGYGFYMFDLATTLSSALNRYDKPTAKQKKLIFETLVNEYLKTKNLSEDDIEMIKVFIIVRDFEMLNWLYNRKDNPNLYNFFKKNKNKKLKKIKTAMSL